MQKLFAFDTFFSDAGIFIVTLGFIAAYLLLWITALFRQPTAAELRIDAEAEENDIEAYRDAA